MKPRNRMLIALLGGLLACSSSDSGTVKLPDRAPAVSGN